VGNTSGPHTRTSMLVRLLVSNRSYPSKALDTTKAAWAQITSNAPTTSTRTWTPVSRSRIRPKPSPTSRQVMYDRIG